MKKRLLFAMALIILSVMLLTACNSDDAMPTRGHWEDSTFVSAYFGLRFALADDWRIWDDIDHPGAAQILAGEQITPETMVRTSEDSAILYDMRASLDDAQGEVSVLVSLLITWFSEELGPISSQSMLADRKEFLAELDNTELEIYEGTTQLGSHEWHLADQIVQDGHNIRLFVRAE